MDVYVDAKPTGYFTAEFDGLYPEPFPKEIRQDGEFGKYMEGWGQPVIGRDRCPDEAMRRCAYTMAKDLKKRPDIVDTMEALDCAARLDDLGPPWLGFCEMTTAMKLGPRYTDRHGGYTRIVKIGMRPGDGASMVQIELVK